MKVYKKQNMQVWSEDGTHYSQKVTLTQAEAKELKLNPAIGVHYCNLNILSVFSGTLFKKHKMQYCNTFYVVVADKKERK